MFWKPDLRKERVSVAPAEGTCSLLRSPRLPATSSQAGDGCCCWAPSVFKQSSPKSGTTLFLAEIPPGPVVCAGSAHSLSSVTDCCPISLVSRVLGREACRSALIQCHCGKIKEEMSVSW